MGWNSIVVINHDVMHTAAQDRDFGVKLVAACSERAAMQPDRPTDVHCGGATPALVCYTNHCSVRPLLIGGYYRVEPVGSQSTDSEVLLRELASQLGYEVRKQRGKR